MRFYGTGRGDIEAVLQDLLNKMATDLANEKFDHLVEFASAFNSIATAIGEENLEKILKE